MIKKRVRTRPRLATGIASALVVASVLVVTILAESSVQQVVPASAAPDRFSAQRALAELERFATQPRPLGSPASDEARRYLVDRLRGAGLQVEVQHSVGVRSAAGLATFGRVDNIVATLPGRNPTGTVVLAAHYDSASMGPGASDDGASVAALLETVRSLCGDAQLRNDLVLLVTDGEEDGSIGAEAFIREHPLARHGGIVLNWEARGVDGPSLMFETSPGNAGIVGLYTASVPHPRGDSSLGEFYRALPNSSDFSTLRRAGFVGMNFAFVDGAARYHTASDSIANLEPGSLQHHGETMLALARAFGDADIPSLGADHDLVHFRLMGADLSYPDALVRPLAGLALLLLAGLVVLARARRAAEPGRILVGALTAVIPLLLSVVLAQALWSFLVAVRPGYDMMGGLLHRPLAYELAIGAISVFALGAWYLALRRRLGPVALGIGALTWFAALGL
ncbi:MAG TPA: M28 family peptidase, partial [Pseudonocardia sp.]